MPTPTDIKVVLDSDRPHASWTLPAELSTPAMSLCCDARSGLTTLRDAKGECRRWANPLDALAWVETSLRAYAWPDARWVGYLSYDVGRLFEAIPAPPADDLEVPLFAFTLHSAGPQHPPVTVESRIPACDAPLRANFTRHGYCAAVSRAIDYIRAGDVFQVNLSQRFTTGLTEPPARIYEHLRRRSPAPYGALLQYGDFAVISNSPELFLQVTPDPATGRRRVVTRPIKGTRPRGPGMEAELRDSVKDQAELNMIIDLERNDLGRVCEIGTVKVTGARAIEAHPTVYHGVATVEGLLRDDVSFVGLLRATFPGGSVTGAPKIRAMQIIDELETVRRGPYCGAIGHLAAGGRMEFNVAIRTIIVKDGLAHVPVGGGIVADSDPAAEYEETLVKARAMFAALGVSADDVTP